MTREEKLKNLKEELLGFNPGDRVRVIHPTCPEDSMPNGHCPNCPMIGTVRGSWRINYFSIGVDGHDCDSVFLPCYMEHLDD
jgi:hypothetical protein